MNDDRAEPKCLCQYENLESLRPYFRNFDQSLPRVWLNRRFLDRDTRGWALGY